MFGNKIVYAEARGARRRGLVWQSGNRRHIENPKLWLNKVRSIDDSRPVIIPFSGKGLPLEQINPDLVTTFTYEEIPVIRDMETIILRGYKVSNARLDAYYEGTGYHRIIMPQYDQYLTEGGIGDHGFRGPYDWSGYEVNPTTGDYTYTTDVLGMVPHISIGWQWAPGWEAGISVSDGTALVQFITQYCKWIRTPVGNPNGHLTSGTRVGKIVSADIEYYDTPTEPIVRVGLGSVSISGIFNLYETPDSGRPLYTDYQVNALAKDALIVLDNFLFI